MKLFITNAQLQERDRWIKLQSTLDAYGAELHEHKDDCLTVREATKDEITSLKDTIQANHEDWKLVVAEMDKGNIRRLRWINGMLITTLLSLIGFLGEQLWTHTIH